MSRILLLVLSLALVELVQAHGLSVHWEVRDGRLVIKADSDGEAAVGAGVEVRSAGDEVLATGKLDETGSWQWPIGVGGELTVVVDAGLGHRRSLTLTGEELRSAKAPASAPPVMVMDPDEVNHEHPAPVRGSSEEAQSLGLRVVVGLTFVLALAAVWMSFGNMRRVDRLERQWKDHEGRG